MFESDLDGLRSLQIRAVQPPHVSGDFSLSPSRHRALGSGCDGRARSPATTSPVAPPQKVEIVQFSDAGQRLGVVNVSKVVKTDDQWRQQLSANVFDIARHADTEMAFTGKYWNLHEKGLYRCLCCDNALFSSETKFDSGT